MTTVFLVSDLHLGAVPAAEGGRYSGAFASFVAHLASTVERGRLVLLGDTFDLLHAGERIDPSPPAAITKLRRLADEHEPVMTKLRSLAAAGWGLDLVVGNHDAELALPEVQGELRRLLPDVRVWPWLLNVPGLLHAEHGHQHHDINTVVEPLGPLAGGAAVLPLASHLSDKRAFVRAALRQRRPSSRHLELLRQEAPRLDLPEGVAIALDRLAARSRLRMAARVLAKAAGRKQAGEYMERAARRVHEVRAAGDAAVPFYVFGHTHRARVLALAPGATYLNCGTWTPFVPNGVPRPWLTTVRVTEGGGEVLRWLDDERRLEPVSAAPAPSTSS